MKLAIELVPKTSWGDNLRKRMKPSQWKIIREKAYAYYGFECGICGAPGRLECHEIWEHDDKKHIQSLRGFIALCSLCHMVKHIGHTRILASQGKLNLESVVEHAVRVNGCSRQEFEAHLRLAFQTWRGRSQYTCTVDLGEYAKLVS